MQGHASLNTVTKFVVAQLANYMYKAFLEMLISKLGKACIIFFILGFHNLHNLQQIFLFIFICIHTFLSSH